MKLSPRYLACLILIICANALAVDEKTTCEPEPSAMMDDGQSIGSHSHLLVSVGVHNISADGPEEIYFKRLSRAVKGWTNLACVDEDGIPRLNQLNSGITRAFKNNPEKALKIVEAVSSSSVDKTLAVLIEANYWIFQAWQARGGGFISSVTPDGLKLFRERLEKAEEVLESNKKVASTNPSWYSLMVEIQSINGGPVEKRNATFLEGAKRYPEFYGLFRVLRWYLTPRWGGSWKTIDEFIEWSTDFNKKKFGLKTYTRLYDGLRLSMPSGEDIFKVTPVKWPKMRAGYEELAKQFPKSKYQINAFASAACQADDRATFMKIRKMVGDDHIEGAWPGDSPIELCDAKFGYRQ